MGDFSISRMKSINEVQTKHKKRRMKISHQPSYSRRETMTQGLPPISGRNAEPGGLPTYGRKAELVHRLRIAHELTELRKEKKKLGEDIGKMLEILLLKDPNTGKEIIRISEKGSDMNPYLRPVGENQVNLLSED